MKTPNPPIISHHKQNVKSTPVKLYIIHGWTYSLEPWNNTIKALKEQGIEPKILKVPGLTTPSEKTWTIQDYITWAEKNLPDNSLALGHSNGGRILLNLATKYPKKLGGLILLDAAGIYEPSAKRTALRKLAKAAAPLKHIKPLRKLFHKFLGASDYDRAPENMKRTLHNMIMSDQHLDPSKITTPTQIIWGEADTVTPLRQAKKLHTLIKNSTLTTIPNWTHAPYINHPKPLAQKIAKATKDLQK